MHVLSVFTHGGYSRNLDFSSSAPPPAISSRPGDSNSSILVCPPRLRSPPPTASASERRSSRLPPTVKETTCGRTTRESSGSSPPPHFHMEAPKQLSNDSFSYSWLINTKPSSLDASLDDAVRFSFDSADPFIEIDPRLASLRWAASDAAVHDFDFGLSGSQSPVLVHADQIFSNGLVLPLHLVTPPRLQQQEAAAPARSSDSSDSALNRSLSLDSSRLLLSLSNRHKSPYLYTVPGRPISLSSSSPLRLDPSAKRTLSRRAGTKLPFLRSCGRTSKKILQKYLCFLVPLYRKVKGLKLVWRAGGSSVVVPSVPRSCAASLHASPRISVDALPAVDYCRFARALDTGMEKSIHEAVLHCKRSIGETRLAGFAQDEQLKISSYMSSQ